MNKVPRCVVTAILEPTESSKQKLNLHENISAGFPSPADDYITDKIDLNKYLIKHPAATFLVRVSGDSMINAGINSGDILIVDRSLDAINNRIVIAVINGELTVKRFVKKKDICYLVPENDNYEPIQVKESDDNIIWGVVTNVVKNLI